MTTISIDILRTFCDPDRKQCETPWSVGAWTFASNGKILVRVKRIPGVRRNKNAPDVISGYIAERLKRSPKCWLPLFPRVPTSGTETKIGRALFSDELLNTFLVFQHVEIGTFGEHDPARVLFDGGEGLIMPVVNWEI